MIRPRIIGYCKTIVNVLYDYLTYSIWVHLQRRACKFQLQGNTELNFK